MARPLRLDFPGAVYHLTARGNARQKIFFDDRDRGLFLANLGRVCAHQAWLCHGYCLMDNHYHLLIETPEGGLSRGMRQVNGNYAQHVNRRHLRGGHLFQGRYGAILVDKESHLLELCRYIVCNPVRAGMVTAPGDYPWSSYNATMGAAPRPGWLHTDWVLVQFAPTRAAARAGYAEFVSGAKAGRRPWDEVTDQVFLGRPEFVAAMKARIADRDTLTEVPRAQRRAPPRTLDWYAASFPGRNQAMYQAYRSHDHTQQAIARHFGLHYSTVSRVLKREAAEAMSKRKT